MATRTQPARGSLNRAARQRVGGHNVLGVLQPGRIRIHVGKLGGSLCQSRGAQCRRVEQSAILLVRGGEQQKGEDRWLYARNAETTTRNPST